MQLPVQNYNIHSPLNAIPFVFTRYEPILPAKFLEKWDYESKEQNFGKIGGVSWQNQMLYLNE